MRRFLLIAIAAVVTGLLAGLVIAGSDDNDSSSKGIRAPDLTIPGDSGTGGTDGESKTGERTSTQDTGTEGDGEQQEPGSSKQERRSGGAGVPEGDTERNDVPPPEDSPAERFERFCEQNPGAC